MKLKDTALEHKEISQAELDLVMVDAGFERSWDYKQITYDYRVMDSDTGENYYIRVPAVAIVGIIEDNGEALLEVGDPYIGRHTYPHGVHYDEEFPEHILDYARNLLNNVSGQLTPSEV